MRYPNTPDCGIKGCTRAAFKGQLCRKHYDLVPYMMGKDCASAVMDAGHRAAQKHHKRQFAFVRNLLANGGTDE